MATIVDWQITELCRRSQLVKPFDPDLVNPASIDVTLGSNIKVEGRICGPENQRKRWLDIELTSAYRLRPGQFILAHTAEIVRVPNWLECQFQLKSSRGREGLNHMLAGYIDPGFEGQITLELHNCNQRHDIEIFAGMKIGQLRFAKVDETPLKGYAVTGRYMNDMGAQASKG